MGEKDPPRPKKFAGDLKKKEREGLTSGKKSVAGSKPRVLKEEKFRKKKKKGTSKKNLDPFSCKNKDVSLKGKEKISRERGEKKKSKQHAPLGKAPGENSHLQRSDHTLLISIGGNAVEGGDYGSITRNGKKITLIVSLGTPQTVLIPHQGRGGSRRNQCRNS